MDLQTDVAIVGGGLAGLVTAVALEREGVDVTVIEAGNRLGGRAQSWNDPVTGDPVHIGPHVFLTEYPNMFKFMDVLGTRDKIVWQDDHFITLARGRESVSMKAAPLPAPFQFMPALLSDDTMPASHVMSNIPVTLYAMQMDEDDVMLLDGINAYAFLRRMGVTKRYIEYFWAFASMAIMNVPVEVCSAGALLRFYARLLGKSKYYFGFADGGLGDVFAPQAQALIERLGGQVMLDTRVTGFTGTPDEVTGVRFEDGRTLGARHVVSALPPQALRQLAPDAWVREMDCFADLVHFHPSPYVSSFIWFDRKLTDLKMWARVHSPNDLNCDFYDLSNINSGWNDRPSVITSNIIYCERVGDMSDEEIVEATVREIAEFLPEATLDRVEHYVINRIPMAIHCPFPGTERCRPETRPPVRNLVLAGDWIKTGLPSSMESACMSGWRAAEAVLEDMGRDKRFAVEHEVEGLTRLVQKTAAYFPPKRALRWARKIRSKLEEAVG